MQHHIRVEKKRKTEMKLRMFYHTAERVLRMH